MPVLINLYAAFSHSHPLPENEHRKREMKNTTSSLLKLNM